MIDVLYFADKEVKQKLFARVKQASKLLMVTAVAPHRAAAAKAHKEPFGALERSYGEVVDQLLVVDEGGAEGMWRDPVTDLADALYPSDSRAAYAAAAGYFFVDGGIACATVKRFGKPEEDLWFLHEALSKLRGEVSAPDPAKRPGRGNRKRAVADERPQTPVGARGKNPYAVLGITSGATLAEAKQAWRALMVQYHPDKVAHLAPEFRTLADTRTREIMDAWTQLQEELD